LDLYVVPANYKPLSSQLDGTNIAEKRYLRQRRFPFSVLCNASVAVNMITMQEGYSE